MSGVFRTIDPPPSPPRVCSVYPPPLVRGEDTIARGRWDHGGSIGWKTPDTALYSICGLGTLKRVNNFASLISFHLPVYFDYIFGFLLLDIMSLLFIYFFIY